MSVHENSPLLLTSPSRRRRELTRSVSDAPKMSKHHHHLHHPHLPGHHRRREHTSILPATSADHLYDPRNEGLVRSNSRAGSRRQSMLGRSEDFEAGGMDGGDSGERRPMIKPGQVKREMEKSALRASELRESLMELNTLSNNTTRQLDSTYYSVLEKHSVLQTTISSMHSIALHAKTLDREFKTESSELAAETDTQLAAFQNFTAQKGKIEAYASRISGAKEKVGALCERLEGVKTRVEAWERSEGEWQLNARRRLRILWGVVVAFVLVAVVLVGVQYVRMRSVDKSYASHPRHVDFGMDGNGSGEGLKKVLEGEKGELGEDPRLRLFDEL